MKSELRSCLCMLVGTVMMLVAVGELAGWAWSIAFTGLVLTVGGMVTLLPPLPPVPRYYFPPPSFTKPAKGDDNDSSD